MAHHVRRRRRPKRFRAACPAELLAPNLLPAQAVALDLSEGGAFVETEAAWPLGLRIKVSLQPPGRSPIVLLGKVLRFGHVEKQVKHPELEYLTVRATGLAIKFDPLDRATSRALESYCVTLEEL